MLALRARELRLSKDLVQMTFQSLDIVCPLLLYDRHLTAKDFLEAAIPFISDYDHHGADENALREHIYEASLPACETQEQLDQLVRFFDDALVFWTKNGVLITINGSVAIVPKWTPTLRALTAIHHDVMFASPVGME